MKAIEVLLGHGASPNIQDNVHLVSSLSVDIYQFVLLTQKGNTPLHLACRLGYPLVAELVLRHGADPAIRNRVKNMCYSKIFVLFIKTVLSGWEDGVWMLLWFYLSTIATANLVWRIVVVCAEMKRKLRVSGSNSGSDGSGGTEAFISDTNSENSENSEHPPITARLLKLLWRVIMTMMRRKRRKIPTVTWRKGNASTSGTKQQQH